MAFFWPLSTPPKWHYNKDSNWPWRKEFAFHLSLIMWKILQLGRAIISWCLAERHAYGDKLFIKAVSSLVTDKHWLICRMAAQGWEGTCGPCRRLELLGHGWHGVRGVAQVWCNSGEGSSTAHIGLWYCFTGPELSVVNYFFSLLIITKFRQSPLSCLLINHLCNFRRQNAWSSQVIMHSIMPVDIGMKVMFHRSIPFLKLISTSDDLMIYLL